MKRALLIFWLPIKRIDGKCLYWAFIWFISNAAFGLAPLLFLLSINPELAKHETTSNIHELLSDGIVLFVCCSLMGSVLMDILIEKLKFRSFAFFAFNISPFALLATICVLYLLLILGHVRKDLFTTISNFYLLVIGFTIFYCILGKYFFV